MRVHGYLNDPHAGCVAKWGWKDGETVCLGCGRRVDGQEVCVAGAQVAKEPRKGVKRGRRGPYKRKSR